MNEEYPVEDLSKYVDMETALARVRGKKKLYRKMLDMFLQSQEIPMLEKALTEKQYTQAGDIAHAIKGMTGNLALTILFETSTKLMEELRHGEPLQQSVTEYLDAVKKTHFYVKIIAEQIDAEGV